jgi:hypothetical protein
MEHVVEKEEYESPSLKAHGSIEAITQGGSAPGVLDANFPVGTPFADLTFS